MVENSRPSTDADVQIFQSANTMTNTRELQKWIRDNGLAKNQIISITSNENDIEEGDQVLTLFYRKKSIVNGASPVDNIQFDSFNNQQSWEKQQTYANSFKVEGRTPDIISITRSPKNIGAARCQTCWYTNEMGHPATNTHLITRGDGDWAQLSVDTLRWLNDYLPPHELISFTMFEEAHPNQTGKVGTLITHKAGAYPRKLADTKAGKNSFVGSVYTMEIVRHEETQGAVQQALQVINRKGGQEGHVVTTTNDSVAQDIFCVVISWNALHESQLVDDLRPTDCCTIF